MSTTDTTNYFLKKVTEGTEVDDWAPFINGNWDKVSTQMKLNADAAAAASTLAGTKAAASHQHNASDINAGTLVTARMPALTGDVTTPVNTVTTTIAANAINTTKLLDANVTNAKLAVGATNTVKGTVNGTSNTDISFATILASGSSSLYSDIVTKTSAAALLLTDAGKLVEVNIGTANDLTIPASPGVAWVDDTEIHVVQLVAAQTRIVAGAGVTIKASGSKLKLTSQYSGCTLKRRGATNDWWVWGDLTA